MTTNEGSPLPTNPEQSHPAYQCTFQVRYGECDPRLHLDPVQLFGYLQETAIQASAAVGRGPGKLHGEGLGWVLLRMRLQIQRPATLGETLRVRTWSSGVGKIAASRELEVVDSDGGPVASATTYWALLDLQRRRPVRIPTWISEPYPNDPRRLHEDPEQDLPARDFSANETRCHEQPTVIPLRRTDFDSNRHARASLYLGACLEEIPTELQRDSTLQQIDIAFEREARAGDTLLSSSYRPVSADASHDRWVEDPDSRLPGPKLVDTRHTGTQHTEDCHHESPDSVHAQQGTPSRSSTRQPDASRVLFHRVYRRRDMQLLCHARSLWSSLC